MRVPFSSPRNSWRVAGSSARLPSVAVRPGLKPSRAEARMPRSTGSRPPRSTRYSSPAASPARPGPSTVSVWPSRTSWVGRGMPVATTSRSAALGGGPGACAPAEARSRTTIGRAIRRTSQRGSRLSGPGRPRPVAGSPRRTVVKLGELRVHRLDLLLGPLDRGLEVELVRAVLGEGVDHDELLVHFVGRRVERPGVADREVVVGVLLERLQLRV